MLQHWRDLQSVVWLLALPAAVAWQWQAASFSPALYGLTLLLVLGLCCINHNHAHVPLWHSPLLNRLSDVWIGTLQGHPVFLFEAAHINSHHRYNQSEQDVTRVSRAGRHNHVVGYLLFPLRVLNPLRQLKRAWLQRLWREQPRQLLWIAAQHMPLLLLWSCCLVLDWRRALLLVALPQLVGLHFLLASNYLQHAAAEPGSRHNHARNFSGRLLNALLFNVGFHSAHHQWSTLHWTQLPAAHARIGAALNPALQHRSLLLYFVLDLTLYPLAGQLRRRRPQR